MRMSQYELYLQTQLEPNRELTLPPPGPVRLSTARCSLLPPAGKQRRRRSAEQEEEGADEDDVDDEDNRDGGGE